TPLLIGLTLVGFLVHQNSNRPKTALSTDRVNLGLSSGVTGKAVASDKGKTAPADSDLLELLFVNAKTGEPVTNRTARLSGWERGVQTLVKKEVSLEQGRCHPPFTKARGLGFWLITRLEGYADTRLRWNPSQGDVIPDSYTVRLIRPVVLSGRVVDPEGKPVPEAGVGIGLRESLGND